MKEFTTFAGFAEELLIIGGKEKLLEHHCLETACVEIEARAKEKIGEYQEQAGPFAAWAPLAASTIEDKQNQGYAPPDNPLLRTGEMQESIEHKVKGNEGHVGSDSDVALWQELGTDKIPARSFLGGSAFELEPKIRRDIGIDFFALLSGGQTRIPIR
jgi:hypothetical protein